MDDIKQSHENESRKVLLNITCLIPCETPLNKNLEFFDLNLKKLIIFSVFGSDTKGSVTTFGPFEPSIPDYKKVLELTGVRKRKKSHLESRLEDEYHQR